LLVDCWQNFRSGRRRKIAHPCVLGIIKAFEESKCTADGERSDHRASGDVCFRTLNVLTTLTIASTRYVRYGHTQNGEFLFASCSQSNEFLFR
jgi:hypothetical protein